MKKKEGRYSPLKNSEIKIGDLVYVLPTSGRSANYSNTDYCIGGINEQIVKVTDISQEHTLSSYGATLSGRRRSLNPTQPSSDAVVVVEIQYKPLSNDDTLDFIGASKKKLKFALQDYRLVLNADNADFVLAEKKDDDQRYLDIKRNISSIEVTKGETKFFIRGENDRGFRNEYIVDDILNLSETAKFVSYHDYSGVKRYASFSDIRKTSYSKELKGCAEEGIKISVGGRGGSVSLNEVVIIDGYITDKEESFFIKCESNLGKNIMKKLK